MSDVWGQSRWLGAVNQQHIYCDANSNDPSGIGTPESPLSPASATAHGYNSLLHEAVASIGTPTTLAEENTAYVIHLATGVYTIATTDLAIAHMGFVVFECAPGVTFAAAAAERITYTTVAASFGGTLRGLIFSGDIDGFTSVNLSIVMADALGVQHFLKARNCNLAGIVEGAALVRGSTMLFDRCNFANAVTNTGSGTAGSAIMSECRVSSANMSLDSLSAIDSVWDSTSDITLTTANTVEYPFRNCTMNGGDFTGAAGCARFDLATQAAFLAGGGTMSGGATSADYTETEVFYALADQNKDLVANTTTAFQARAPYACRVRAVYNQTDNKPTSAAGTVTAAISGGGSNLLTAANIDLEAQTNGVYASNTLTATAANLILAAGDAIAVAAISNNADMVNGTGQGFCVECVKLNGAPA